MNKWDIHPWTPFWVLLALLSNQAKPIFLNYLLALVHELGHLTVAFFLHVKIEKIMWLPFGFYAQMPSISDEHFLKEFFVLIAGPLMFFTNQQVIGLMFQNHWVSYHGFLEAEKFNTVLLWFNIIPLIPLDGSRLFHWLISFFITERLALMVTGVVSTLALSLMVATTELGNSWLIIIFLVNSLISYFRWLPQTYVNFLLNRSPRKMKLPLRIHSQNDLYRHFNNYTFRDGVLWSEFMFIRHRLSAIIKKRFFK